MAVTQQEASLHLEIVQLRADVHYGRLPEEESSLASAYGIASVLATAEIAKVEGQGSATALLTETAELAKPRELELYRDEEEGAAAGTFDFDFETLRINTDPIYPRDEGDGEYALGFRFHEVDARHPGDERFIVFMHTMAHEAGHAALHGIGKSLVDDRNAHHPGLLATKSFLVDYPEEGFTGHWNTDVYIREERFVEGYSHLALAGLLTILGYDEDEISSIRADCILATDVAGELGSNQVDFLDDITAKIGPADKVKSSLESRKYPGALGYEPFLISEDIIRQLKALAKLQEQIKRGEHAFSEPLPETWFANVRANQKSEIAQHLDLLRQRREFEFTLSPRSGKSMDLTGLELSRVVVPDPTKV
jgi:hypothetical protein